MPRRKLTGTYNVAAQFARDAPFQAVGKVAWREAPPHGGLPGRGMEDHHMCTSISEPPAIDGAL